MPVFGSEQIRCSLVQDRRKKKKNDAIDYVLSYEDGTPIDEEEEVDIGQEEWPHSYPPEKKFFSWKFLDHTPDMRIKVQLRAFQEAFNSVEQLTKLKIDFERDDTKKTDITVEWLEDIASFNDKFSVLAHAYLFHPQSKKNGVIEFNDSPASSWYFTPLGWPVEAYLVDATHYTKGQKDANGNLLMMASQPTIKITMHELGHILGLRHDIVNRASLMYPSISTSYRNGKIIKESFYWDSVSSVPRLHKRYGSSNILRRWLQRWGRRRTGERTYRRYEDDNI